MKKIYTVLGLSPQDPKSNYVNEYGEEFKCTDKVYFPITAYLTSLIKDNESFILYAVDSGQNEHTLRKNKLLQEEIEKYFPGQCDYRYLKADLESNAKGQIATFKKLYNTFIADEGTFEVYFDVTFGFRPTPMTIFVACNYAEKFLDNIKIKNLIYSQFDFKNKDKPQLIVDITSLFLLNNIIDTLSSMNSSNPMKFLDGIFNVE